MRTLLEDGSVRADSSARARLRARAERHFSRGVSKVGVGGGLLGGALAG